MIGPAAAVLQAIDEGGLPVLIADGAGILVHANAGACRALGASMHDVVGRPGSDFIPPDDHAFHERRRRILTELGVGGGRRRALRADGSEITVHVATAKVEDHLVAVWAPTADHEAGADGDGDEPALRLADTIAATAGIPSGRALVLARQLLAGAAPQEEPTPRASASERLTDEMTHQGRMVCEACGAHTPPARECPVCGGALRRLDA